MKILIENTVPLNNGDAALIFGLGNKIKAEGHEVVYSTMQLDKSNQLYPNEKWVESMISTKISRRPIVGQIFIFFLMFLNKKEISQYDMVISAPGGYFNSYYSLLQFRLFQLFLYKKMFKKKVIVYSQSFGPFSKKDEKVLKKYLPKIDLVYARDTASFERLNNLGLVQNVELTKDAAFLLDRIKNNNKNKKVAISVRSWKFDNRSKEEYFKLIERITHHLINKGFHVEFISTCQGITGYIDDSIVAQQIVDEFDEDLKEKVTIDKKYYNIYDFREKLTTYDYTIGTRLHMCILSWLSSVPAFNISYEEKGKECYSYLGLTEYSIDYNFQGEVESKIDEFIQENFEQETKLIDEINLESVEFLKRII